MYPIIQFPLRLKKMPAATPNPIRHEEGWYDRKENGVERNSGLELEWALESEEL